MTFADMTATIAVDDNSDVLIPMTDKQLVIDAVSRLPDATTFEAIQEEIEILAAIRRGEEAVAAGRVVPHEEVKKLVAEWNSK